MSKSALTVAIAEQFLSRKPVILIRTREGEDWIGIANPLSISRVRGKEVIELNIDFEVFFAIHEVTKIGHNVEKHWEPIPGRKKAFYEMKIARPILTERHHSRIVCRSDNDMITISHEHSHLALMEKVAELYEQ